MKRLSHPIVAAAFCIIFLSACVKENTDVKQSANNKPVTANTDVASATINKLTGNYQVSGTRTFYNGVASDTSLLFSIDLATLGLSPKVMTAADQYTLLCDYADLGASGWQYVIKGDPNTGEWTVEANDAMLSLITPGSFRVLDKQFYKHHRKFYFKTMYTNQLGNDRIVEETLVQEP